MRKLENLVLNINEKGMQVRTTADFPAGEFGTIYTPPYRIKTDALRTGGQQWIMAKDTDFMRYEGPRIITLNGRKVRVLGIRRLTPTECARLQTIPQWYKWDGMSDSQRYRVLGNGWTVEVIKHFFSFLPWEKKEA